MRHRIRSLHAVASLFVVLLMMSAQVLVHAQQREIVIPAINIPARTIPGYTIPERRIPERTTVYGVIPEIVIPSIEIPTIHVPAINTTEQAISIVGYEPIYRSNTERFYQQERPEQVSPHFPARTTLTREERDAAFSTGFPYANRQLLNLFAAADVDRSGTLSWREFIIFQDRLYRSFSYIPINTALPPDEFLSRGGGNCVDWSLMTVAFARYWGWEAFVGAFFDAQSGHAVAFVRSPLAVPNDLMRINLRDARTQHGDLISDGTYVPVDYNQVGAYSSATRAGMRLEYFMNPDRMYGVRM